LLRSAPVKMTDGEIATVDAGKRVAGGAGPTLLGSVGWLYGTVALVMSRAFVARAIAVWQAADDYRGHVIAQRMFRFSLLYLAILFAALPFDRMLFG